MCWLDTFTDTEIRALLATARATAGPLTAPEARRVLDAATNSRRAGTALPAIETALSDRTVLALVIRRPCRERQAARVRGEERGG
jgi:hypothetical protein